MTFGIFEKILKGVKEVLGPIEEQSSLEQRAQSIADTLRKMRAELGPDQSTMVSDCDKHINWLQSLSDATWHEEHRSHKQGLLVQQLLDSVIFSGFQPQFKKCKHT